MNKHSLSRIALAASLCLGAGALQAQVPVERIEGVETVTMETDRGPVVVISFPVSGNVHESNYNIDFTLIDKNDDGYISRDEAQAMASHSDAARNLAEQFGAADRSDDGRLGFVEVLDWVY